MIKKFSAPCTSISLQDNALSQSLFELSYPFEIVLFLFPQVLVYYLYDAFIASILCTKKMGFQFWVQIEVRRHIGRTWGMRKDFKYTLRCSSHGNLWRVAGALSCKSRTQRVSFPRLFLAISWRSCLNSTA